MSISLTRRGMLTAVLSTTSVCLFAGKAKSAAASDTVVIYFSRTGTTANLARKIAAYTKADCIELKLQKPYAKAYSDMTDIARNERRSGARREIATVIADLSGYKNVFIGSPYWWGGISIPMRTFLSDHPLAGKRVMPFVVSASSSPEGAWADIGSICQEAVIEEGFHVTESNAERADEKLNKWLVRLGY